MSIAHSGESVLIRASRVGVLLASGLWAASRAVSSGDLWIALGCGRYTLAHGVTRNDPFAFTSIPGHWVNQNWMSHVLFTWINAAAGLTGLGLWKGLVALAIVWLGADAALALGAGPILAAAAAVALGLTGRPFFDMRPNLHTILIAAILVRWIVGIEKRPVWKLWPYPVLMILWANLHGGFLFGVIVAGAVAAAIACDRLARGRRAAAWPWIVALPLVGLAASLVSPYGITNLTHPWEISFSPAAKHWRGVVEWLPPYVAGALEDPGVRAFWIIFAFSVLLGTALLVLHLRRRGRGPSAHRKDGGPSLLPVGAVAGVSLLLALTSRRFIPLFAVAALPCLAAAIARTRLVRPMRIPSIAWPIAACVALAGTGIEVGQRLFTANDFWPRSVGWAARLIRADEQPRDAVRFLTASGIGGRLLTDWTWGGYLLYADPFDGDSPRYRIYIDGRAQAAFPVSASIDYVDVEGAAAAGQVEPVRSFLDHYGVDICVLDCRDMGLTLVVMQLPEWVSVYGDDRAVIAVRKPAAAKMRNGPFPDPAVARASEAMRIRTSLTGRLDAESAGRAFDAAVASLAIRPTTIGVTEMTRISRTAPGGVGPGMRARAAEVCDSLLSRPVRGDAVPLCEALTLRANIAQCRSVLARSAHDLPLAERWRSEAASLVERTDAIGPRYLR